MTSLMLFLGLFGLVARGDLISAESIPPRDLPSLTSRCYRALIDHPLIEGPEYRLPSPRLAEALQAYAAGDPPKSQKELRGRFHEYSTLGESGVLAVNVTKLRTLWMDGMNLTEAGERALRDVWLPVVIYLEPHERRKEFEREISLSSVAIFRLIEIYHFFGEEPFLLRELRSKRGEPGISDNLSAVWLGKLSSGGFLEEIPTGGRAKKRKVSSFGKKILERFFEIRLEHIEWVLFPEEEEAS